MRKKFVVIICPIRTISLLKVLRRQGHRWNHKRVYRVYCELKLNMRRKGKKRLPNRSPEPLSVPASINQCWSMDFMCDALMCGRRSRIFNLVDDFNGEVLAIEIDLSLPAQRVVRVLERVVSWRGLPAKLRMNNGLEFISSPLADWLEILLSMLIMTRGSVDVRIDYCLLKNNMTAKFC